MEKLKTYKALTSEDMSSPKWRFAPILVSTNRERFDITHTQAINFAKEHKTVVLRWPKKIKTWYHEFPPDTEQQIQKDDPLFWQYFVVDAPAYIIDNINVSKKIANGMSAKCHSVTLRDKQQQIQLETDIEQARPGTIIDLPRAPLSVNLELFIPIRKWKAHSLF